MASNWKTSAETRPGILQFADLAVRAERLLVAHRLKCLNTLVKSQTRTLSATAEGKKALLEVQRHVAQAQQLLRGKPHAQ